MQRDGGTAGSRAPRGARARRRGSRRRRAAPASAIGARPAGTSGRARGPGASRPLRPASCVTSWNVRSSARKSGMRETGVGVDDRGERDAREVVALGDHLRAEQHRAVAPRRSAERVGAALPASTPCPRRAGSARAPGTRARARARAAACPAPIRASSTEPQAGQRLRRRLASSRSGGSAAPVAVQRERDVAVAAAPRRRRRRGSGAPARPRGG